MKETLRVKGTAVISRDPVLLEQLSARGKPAKLVARVKVRECFFHCGKAMIRSEMWKPDRWTVYTDSLLAQGLASQIKSDEINEKLVEDALETSYREELY